MAISRYNSRTTRKNTTRSLSGGRDGNVLANEQAAVLEDKRARAQSQTATTVASAPQINKPVADSPLPQVSTPRVRQRSVVSSPLPEAPSYESNVAVSPLQKSKDLVAEQTKLVLAPSKRKPRGRAKVRKELAEKRTLTQQIVADELNKQIDLTLNVQPPNNNNPVTKTNQYTQGGEYISAIGKDYVGFYHVLADDTTLVGRGQIGEIPKIRPERLLYSTDKVLPDLIQDKVTANEIANRNPDFGLIIPVGHPLGVGATHQSSGHQFYNCPPEVPITHPIVERCKKIDKKITNELLK